IHSRDLLSQRAMLEGSRLVLLSATPSVESWWRAEAQQAIRGDLEETSWPEVVTADTRGILRNHPLTLPLTRSIEDMTRRGRRVLLVVTRRAGALICPECGGLMRCGDCGVPLAFSRETKTLRCRLCAKAVGPNGRLIIQTLHPEHYAVRAVKEQDRRSFYKQEILLRTELGYPPFRRLCVVSVRGLRPGDGRARIDECAQALRGIAGLTIYPPAPLGASGARSGRWQFVIKGPVELPRLIGPALAPFLTARRRG